MESILSLLNIDEDEDEDGNLNNLICIYGGNMKINKNFLKFNNVLYFIDLDKCFDNYIIISSYNKNVITTSKQVNIN